MEEPGKGFLRVVATPRPIDIVEIDAIKTLADADQVVIACGGGGIPVIEQQHSLKGASAVIEKDSVAGKLAADLKSDQLIILTSVDHVSLNFGKENEAKISSMNVPEAEKYIGEEQFGAGNMLPKIEAAIAYLKAVPEGSVLITSMRTVKDAIKGKAGTLITS